MGARRRRTGPGAADPRVDAESVLAVVRERLVAAAEEDADPESLYRRTLASLFAAGWPGLDDLRPHAIGPLYESLLGYRLAREDGRLRLRRDRSDRRRSGSYYTPPWVAELTVEETVGPMLAEGADPETLRVLDPAMGAGVFLLAAARRLGGAAPRLGGIDRDAGAVAAARLALDRAGAGARASLLVGDALLAEVHASGSGPDPLAPGHTDVVLGNPPFLNVKRGSLRHLRQRLGARYRSARGQWDAWALFLELAIEVLRPGGRLGLVLPRPFLASESYAHTRRTLLSSCRLERVIELGAVFSGANVEAVICIGRKRGDAPRRARPLRFVDVTRDPPSDHAGPPCRVFLRLPHAAIPPAADRAATAFLLAMQRAPARLDELVEITRGLECGKRSPAVFADRAPGRMPLLTGDCVTAFRIGRPAFVDLTGVPGAHGTRTAMFAARPKLLVRRVTDRLTAAVDGSGACTLNTLYVLVPRGPSPAGFLHCLAALLNSGPLRRYHRLAFAAEDRLFPYVRISQLKRLPVPSRETLMGPEAEHLARLGRLSAADSRHIHAAEIDAIAGRLYGIE